VRETKLQGLETGDVRGRVRNERKETQKESQSVGARKRGLYFFGASGKEIVMGTRKKGWGGVLRAHCWEGSGTS